MYEIGLSIAGSISHIGPSASSAILMYLPLLIGKFPATLSAP